MIVSLCGKGGCGKSTVAALLAKEFAQEGKNVLVLDTDESNYGLHRQLGLPLPQNFTDFFGGKVTIQDSVVNSNLEPSFFDKTWSITEIPQEYISEKDGIKLISIGKISESGEGCACPMGIIARQFICNLRLYPNDVVILDTEAGIEHLGRGVEMGVDALLMVIDPSYESILLSSKLSEMGDNIHKPVYFILNKVDSECEETLRKSIEDESKIIAVISPDKKIAFAGLRGDELSNENDEIKNLALYLNEHIC